MQQDDLTMLAIAGQPWVCALCQREIHQGDLIAELGGEQVHSECLEGDDGL